MKEMPQWEKNSNDAWRHYGNGLLTYKNKTQTVVDWANELKLHPDTLLARLWERRHQHGVNLDYVFRYRLTPLPEDWKPINGLEFCLKKDERIERDSRYVASRVQDAEGRLGSPSHA